VAHSGTASRMIVPSFQPPSYFWTIQTLRITHFK
jgi:hypothetical protein